MLFVYLLPFRLKISIKTYKLPHLCGRVSMNSKFAVWYIKPSPAQDAYIQWWVILFIIRPQNQISLIAFMIYLEQDWWTDRYPALHAHFKCIGRLLVLFDIWMTIGLAGYSKTWQFNAVVLDFLVRDLWLRKDLPDTKTVPNSVRGVNSNIVLADGMSILLTPPFNVLCFVCPSCHFHKVHALILSLSDAQYKQSFDYLYSIVVCVSLSHYDVE